MKMVSGLESGMRGIIVCGKRYPSMCYEPREPTWWSTHRELQLNLEFNHL